MTNFSKQQKELTASEFISSYKTPNCFVEDAILIDKLVLKSQDYSFKNGFFKNVTFKDDIQIQNCNLNDGLKFVNCQFDKRVIFLNCLSNKSDFDFLPGDKSLEFVDCTINEIGIQDCRLEGGVVFYNSNLDVLNAYGTHVTVGGGLDFSKTSIVNKSINVSNCNFKGQISLSEGVFNGYIRFENNITSSYDFSFSSFSKNIFIWAGFCKSIIFYQSKFEDDFNLQVVKIDGSLSIIECSFKKIFRIELDELNGNIRGFLKSIYLSQSDFLNVFSLKQFKSDRTSIKKIDLIFQNLNGSFLIDDISIDEMHISGYNTSSRLVLENVVLNNLYLEKFRNAGSIDFINVRPGETESQIGIQSSILGSFAFVNCQLMKFKTINIHDSIFDQVISSGTKWFDFKHIIHSIDTPKVNWFKRVWQCFKMLFHNLPDDNLEVQKLYQIREIFRQLKVSMDKQGNRIQGLYFQSQEFIAYQKELKLTHSIYMSERLILSSNKSNSHGQNWLKPIILGVLFTLVLFTLMVYSMNPNLSITAPWNSDFISTFQVYNEYINSIPELFNPTFRLDLVFQKQVHELDFWTYFIALVQRISISYFIFQTISAFRKYLK
jgi:hypothetical protein